MKKPRRWPGILLRLLAAATVVLLILTYISTDHFRAFGGSADPVSLARMRLSPLFDGHRFHNAEPDLKVGWRLGWSATYEWFYGTELREPSCPLPLFAKTRETLRAAPGTGLRITWLGHSTTLIELDGAIILTDPVWSERASPSQWVGPKRFHPPPLPLADLPHIDAVLISHDHFDHLDMATIRELSARGVPFHVPLGIGAHLAAWGVPQNQIFEHDWWESTRISHDINLISTPSRHFSGRGAFWRSGTHWTSWSLIGPNHRVFFSGDTGMTEAFREIAKREGPFDVALIEIGQWHPSWGDIHLGPIGALDAFAMLDANAFIPIHWGTFNLAIHDWNEPPETLSIEAEKRGVKLFTPLLGEPIEPSANPVTNRWWRAYPPIAKSCPAIGS